MAVPSPISWLAFALSVASVPAALWWNATERRVQSAADAVGPILRTTDLVLVSSALDTRRNPDRGGLMRPFGVSAVNVMDPAGPVPDLSQFPSTRAFLVGPGWDTQRLGLTDGKRLSSDVVLAERPGHGEALSSLLDESRVEITREGEVRGCTQSHPGGGVRCGSQAWQYVAPVVIEAAGKLHACAWAHPVNGYETRLTLPADISHGALWGQYSEDALRDQPRPPVTFTVDVDGAPAAQAECRNDTASGRCTFSFARPPGSNAPVVVRWSTMDTARQVICVGGLVERG